MEAIQPAWQGDQTPGRGRRERSAGRDPEPTGANAQDLDGGSSPRAGADSHQRGRRFSFNVATASQCAVERRVIPVGANPTQPLSLRLEAARAVYGGNDVDRSTLA